MFLGFVQGSLPVQLISLGLSILLYLAVQRTFATTRKLGWKLENVQGFSLACF